METIQLDKSNMGKRTARQLVNQTRRFLTRNYYSAKAYNHFLLWVSNLRSKESQDKILIYQVGKVGSETILSSLEALEIDASFYHVHVLTKDGINRFEKFYKNNWLGPSHAKNLWESQFLRRQIDNGLKGSWKIVTLVRDPIARDISAFFQTVDRLPNYNYKQKISSTSPEIIAKELVSIYLEKVQIHTEPFAWFNYELKPVFNIDVFSSDFPKSRGYNIYKKEHVEVLLLKLENLNQCAGEAFKEFLGVDEFTLAKKNVASEKSYSDVYQKFLDSIVLPEFYINQVYASELTQRFYSEAEIDKFKAKWCRK